MTSVPDGDPAEHETQATELVFADSTPKGHPLIAWLVIVAVVLLILTVSRAEPEDENDVVESGIEHTVIELQGKYLVGAAQMPGVDGTEFLQQAEPLNTGPLGNRLRFVVLTGELADAAAAVDQLEQLAQQLEQSEVEPTADQSQLINILSRLYADYEQQEWDAASLDAAERELLRSRLDWFGELALAPPESADSAARSAVLAPATRTMVVVLLFAVAGSLGGMGSLALLILFIVSLARGKLRSRLYARTSDGALYAETFAVWMLLFVGLSAVIPFIPGLQTPLLLNLAVFLLSLSALFWPVLRGLSWQQVRRDVGLTFGPRPLLEPFWGIVCYISTLPLVAIGLLLVMVMLQLQGLVSEVGGDPFQSAPAPSHPIVEWIGDFGWWGRVLVFAVACIAAPLVEETMFRGVLYRHLRNSTAAWRISLSILFSVVVNSFLFAVIHPQGYLAVPVLMSLAAGFSLTREWRGSLFASMTAHAANNALAITGMFFLL